eukprot:s1867_g9.t1
MVEVEDTSGENGPNQITAENLNDLQRSVFILQEELDKEPYLGNAFGRVADLCFFVAECDDLSSQQAKYICSVLPQLLMVKDCGVAINYLIGFLPKPAVIVDAVMCPKLGQVLLALRRVAEAASDLFYCNLAAASRNEFPHCGPLTSILKGADTLLTVNAIKDISKKLATFPTSTGYKQIMVCLREAESQAQMDKALDTKVAGLRDLEKEIEQIVSEGHNRQTARLMNAEKFLTTLQKVILGIATIPSDPSSKHVDLRDALVGAKNSFEAELSRFRLSLSPESSWNYLSDAFITTYVNLTTEYILEVEEVLVSAKEADSQNPVPELVQDLLAVAGKYNSQALEDWLKSCPGMSSSCRDAIRSAVYFANAYAFYMNSSNFVKGLTESDVKFELYSPISQKSKDALSFSHVASQLLESQKALNEDFTGGPLTLGMWKVDSDVLHALREVVLSPEFEEGKSIDAACAADYDNMSPVGRAQALETLSGACAKLHGLKATHDNTERLKDIQNKLSIVKKAVEKDQGSFSDAELSAKNRLEQSMEDLKAAFPPLNESQLQEATLKVLKEMVVPKKNLSELTSKFFQVKQSCDCDIGRFGKFFSAEIAYVSGKAKALLAIQSAFSVLNAKRDARTKAATFEKDKLSPKGISLSDLPRCIVAELTELSSSNASSSSSKPAQPKGTS